MKFSCEKLSLVSAISLASRVVAVKSAISALEGIFLKAGTTGVSVTGYNLETGITATLPAEVQESGECVMPARLFFDIIRKLPDDTVSITVDEKFKVSIRGGISSFTIAASSGDDYPELPDVEAEKSILIPQTELAKLISGTLFSVSENKARPIHTGCLFEIEDDSVTVIAVDGFRLALRRYFPETPIGRKLKFVVPASALKEVEKILDDGETSASIYVGNKHILFSFGACTLVCRILEGEFLDWRRVLPQNNPIKLAANVSQLTDSIERVSLVVSEKIKTPVRCVFGENTADLRTLSTIGDAHDVCPISGNGGDLEIGFNCNYLIDALRHVPTEEVILELSNGLSPIVLSPCDEKQTFSYMVLPVRLKAGV